MTLPATTRQRISLAGLPDALDITIQAIVDMLDATLVAHALTRHQLCFLPEASDFQIVDLAVRQWGQINKATIKEDAHDGPSGRIEVYRVNANGNEIVTVHRPRELHRTQADSDGMWLPSDCGAV